MSSYIIQGGKKLEGVVKVSGSKNASLPILAASILNGGTTKLYNVPNIHDAQKMLEILKLLGCKVKKKENKVIIDSSNLKNYEIPENLMREMRSSVILAGSIIGRNKKATFSYPGGCDIGARPIDLHLKAFEKLGISIKEEGGKIECTCDKIKGTKIDLDFPSVGATENAILAACLAEGETIITNAAREPEIMDLEKFLNRMGARVEGAGTNQIKITGVKKLKNVEYNIMPDRIEAGTFLVAGAMTSGKIELINVVPEHIEPIINKLQEANCKIEVENNKINLIAPKRLKAVDIKTMPYPGFPTDMQAVFGAAMTISKGTSVIVENIFENRYKYMQELVRMGAKVTIEGRTAVVKGVKKLHAANVKSTDLRGGAALVLAGLATNGITEVEEIQYILRGYENLEKKLTNLGAKIYLK
ncbi:MAG: UDP-N-acetylglucosamine 1-carboxyvinyltransferase [Clostridia bacterium]|nr:UDP-N-acetylglucosamine 1-carboxyvinyltransferase [Clostridia bacterium]